MRSSISALLYRVGLVAGLLAGAVSASSAAVDCDRLLNEPDYKPPDLAAPMRFLAQLNMPAWAMLQTIRT